MKTNRTCIADQLAEKTTVKIKLVLFNILVPYKFRGLELCTRDVPICV
jgi:hypothetical protein